MPHRSLIGFIQEGKAEPALEGIRKMLSLHAHTRRDGKWIEIDAGYVVPGDLVRLRSGDRVPADLRLIESVNPRIEESALTGESAPTDKQTQPADSDAGVGDRHCMAYCPKSKMSMPAPLFRQLTAAKTSVESGRN